MILHQWFINAGIHCGLPSHDFSVDGSAVGKTYITRITYCLYHVCTRSRSIGDKIVSSLGSFHEYIVKINVVINNITAAFHPSNMVVHFDSALN